MGNQIHIIDGRRNLFLPLDDIIFVKADGNYCEICLTNSFYPDVRILLGELWNKIEKEGAGYPHHLERISRSLIINMDLLIKADPKKGTITLHTEKEDKVIKAAKVAIVELIKKLGKEKRREVLSIVSYKQKLTVPLEELNDEHLKECGQEYVDLGLTSGTLWATRNVSSRHPELTEYYGWGQLYLSDSYDEDGYHMPSPKMQGWDVLPLEHDVARQDWGGGWRIPTEEEFEELERECILTCCREQNGGHGVLVTGPNGNAIFLPTGGLRDGMHILHENEGAYWTASNSKLNGHAISATFVDSDDKRNLASTILGTENWYKGLSIRPVLSQPTNPEAPKTKTQLIINDINIQFGEHEFSISPILNGWRFRELDIPASPKDAMNLIRKFCDKYSPDVIVGIRTGCFYVHQMKGYKRICASPLLHPSELFPVGVHEYMESFTDETSFEITPQIHEEFIEMEKHQFDSIDSNDCWCLYFDVDDNDVQEFCDHYTEAIDMSYLKHRRGWQSTVLVPLIKKITK